MKTKDSKWIIEANKDIQQGRGDHVRKKLRVLQDNGVPQKEVEQVAILAKRVGMYQFATNLLYRDLFKVGEEPRPQILAEYASCLTGVGNYLEANEIFSKLPDSELEKNVIQYANSLFHCWEYQKAENILSKFGQDSLDDYRSLIYGINWASSLISVQKYKLAENLLNKIRTKTKKEHHLLLYANSLELLGQIRYFTGDLQAANKLFIESEKLLRNSNNISWLYAYKWCVISQVVTNNNNQSVIELFDKVRTQARTFLHWETLRDCDLYQSIYTHDSKTYSRVYFGTPHKAFRERASTLSENKITLDPEVIFGSGQSRSSSVLDLSTVEFKPLDIDWTNSTRKLLVALTKDLYRPISIYQLNREIFGEEHFNPLTSRDKTYKVIANLRLQLKNSSTMCSIENRRDYGYRFRCEIPFSLIYPDSPEMSLVTIEQKVIGEVSQHFGKIEFKRKDFCLATNLNDRTGIRLLKQLIEEGRLIKLGSGPNTRYKLCS